MGIIFHGEDICNLLLFNSFIIKYILLLCISILWTTMKEDNYVKIEPLLFIILVADELCTLLTCFEIGKQRIIGNNNNSNSSSNNYNNIKRHLLIPSDIVIKNCKKYFRDQKSYFENENKKKYC